MKRIVLLTGFLLTVAFAMSQKINDPNAEVREAKNFHGISVSNAFNVYLDQSNTEAVAVSASEIKYRDQITVEVKDGILHIGLKNETWRFKGNKRFTAYISFKAINKLIVRGACDVYMAEGAIKADELKIDLSGASDIRKIKLDVKKLDVELSGASDADVSGTALQVVVRSSGASAFKGIDLVTEICDAHASGASDIRITVNKELSAHATGASDVRYKGDGVIRDIKTSGASNIRRI